MLVYKKIPGCKNDRTNVSVTGATTEVATLKEALSKAEDNAAVERTSEKSRRRGWRRCGKSSTLL